MAAFPGKSNPAAEGLLIRRGGWMPLQQFTSLHFSLFFYAFLFFSLSGKRNWAERTRDRTALFTGKNAFALFLKWKPFAQHTFIFLPLPNLIYRRIKKTAAALYQMCEIEGCCASGTFEREKSGAVTREIRCISALLGGQ